MVQNIKSFWQYLGIILLTLSVSSLLATLQTTKAEAATFNLTTSKLAPGQQVSLTGSSFVLRFCNDYTSDCRETTSVTFRKEGNFSFIARDVSVTESPASCNYDFNVFYTSGNTQANFQPKLNGGGPFCPTVNGKTFNVTPADVNVKTSAVYEACEAGKGSALGIITDVQKAACLKGAASPNDPSVCDGDSTGYCKTGQTAAQQDAAASGGGGGGGGGGAGGGSDTGDGEGGAAAEPSCTGTMRSIGWWLCSALEAALNFADGLWGLLEHFLHSKPLTSDGAAFKTWESLRNLANALLAVIFLFVIYSQITNLGISNYGIKKILPRLIIMSILINISFFVVQAAVDISNVLGKTLHDLIAEDATARIATVKMEGLLEMIVGGATITLGAAAVGTLLAPMISAPAAIIFLAVIIIPAIIGIIAAVITLFVRGLVLHFVAVLAPIAMAAYVLPNTQSLFDKWMKVFSSILFLYPAASIYFGALKVGAAMAITEGGILEKIIGFAALLTGAGFIFVMAIKSNAILGKVAGAASGVLNKAAAPIAKAGKAASMARQGLKYKQFKNRDFSPQKGPGSRGFMGHKKLQRGMGRLTQGVARGFETRAKARDSAGAAADVQAGKRFNEDLIAGYDPDNDPNAANYISPLAKKAAGGDEEQARYIQEKAYQARRKEEVEKAGFELSEQINTMARTNPEFDTADHLSRVARNKNLDSNGKEVEANYTEYERDAALQMAASKGLGKTLRQAQTQAYSDRGSLGEKSRLSRALESNYNALKDKDPDLVKGGDRVFKDLNPAQMGQLSSESAQAMVNVANGQGEHAAATRQRIESNLDQYEADPRILNEPYIRMSSVDNIRRSFGRSTSTSSRSASSSGSGSSQGGTANTGGSVTGQARQQNNATPSSTTSSTSSSKWNAAQAKLNAAMSGQSSGQGIAVDSSGTVYTGANQGLAIAEAKRDHAARGNSDSNNRRTFSVGTSGGSSTEDVTSQKATYSGVSPEGDQVVGRMTRD